MSTACDRQQQRAAKRANKPPSGKQIEELADRAEASGCDRCGTRFAELLPYFICRTTAYAFSVRCENCSRLSAEPVFVGIYYGGGHPWSAEDRAWFAKHSNRRWRLRTPFPGELSPAALGGLCTAERMDAFIVKARKQSLVVAIATYQAEVGKRLRKVVAVPTRDPLESFTDRSIAVLIPGIDERTIAAAIPNNDVDWENAHRKKMEERWSVFLAGSTS